MTLIQISDMSKLEAVNTCRICGSEYLIDLDQESSFYLLNMDKTLRLKYIICRRCHFICHSEYVGDDFVEEYYNKSLMLRREDATEIESRQYEEQTDFVKKHYDIAGKKVLEIGADSGRFLMYLKSNYDCNVYFDELSEDARKVLLSKKVITDIATVDVKERMDVVVLRHVLEHIFDLKGFLKYVKTRLADDGMLFIEVPDWSYLDKNTDPLIFEHFNQFSSYNLNFLLRDNGFIVDGMEKDITPEFLNTSNRVMRVVAKPTHLAGLNQNDIKYDFKHYHDVYMRIYVDLNNRLDKVPNTSKIALYPGSHLTFEALFHSNLKNRNVVGIFDIDERKHGKKVMDIPILPPEKLMEMQPNIVFILTMGAYEREIFNYVSSLQLGAEIVSWSELNK